MSASNTLYVTVGQDLGRLASSSCCKRADVNVRASHPLLALTVNCIIFSGQSLIRKTSCHSRKKKLSYVIVTCHFEIIVKSCNFKRNLPHISPLQVYSNPYVTLVSNIYILSLCSGVMCFQLTPCINRCSFASVI